MRLIWLSYQCNNSCIFCAQGKLRSLQNGPAALDIEKEIRESAWQKETAIAFVGGEPTLFEQLPSWVSLAKQSEIGWVLVQTNGRRLMYPGYAKTLSAAGVDALDVSLQGCTAAMHEYHTQVPGSFLQTVSGIKAACEAKIPVGVSTVVTRSNFRHLTDMVRLSSSLGSRAIRLEIARDYGNAAVNYDRIVPQKEMVLPFLMEAVRAAGELKLGIFALDKASSEPTARLFAGLGLVETVARPQDKRERLSAAAPEKAKPALREARHKHQKTGEALRDIFPELFKTTNG